MTTDSETKTGEFREMVRLLPCINVCNVSSPDKTKVWVRGATKKQLEDAGFNIFNTHNSHGTWQYYVDRDYFVRVKDEQTRQFNTGWGRSQK